MKNYLDIWTAEKLNTDNLTREALENYQLEKLKETFDIAVKNSPYYAGRFNGMEVKSLDDFRKLPFTTPEDVCEHGMEMLCVSQREISRIVTMETSGTTGKPKRIYFTEADQELTVDFFHHGMKLIVDEKDTVMILMPCQRPGSIGTLLQESLERSGVRVIPYGLPDGADEKQILELMEREQVTSCVALATQLANIAEKSAGYKIPMRTVLLSAEYVSEESRRIISETWNCKIFEHYGMTEMGLGCAVHCPELDGCHVRELDLYLEIIDPVTGEILPDGQEGEIVFTTLTRKGMPFIRYRTGDWSSFMTDNCRCGSVLKRITRVGDRGLKKGGLYGE